MAAMADLIDFDIIEGSKENIQQLPSGRSAKALHAILSPVALKSPSNTQDVHDGTRQQYEKEIAMIDDSDDPLDVYDRYVKWTMDAYPSAQSTPQSQLLPLLERATKTFLSFSNYKNDPRYLKLWLHYIRLFSDAPREIFAYLARHGIGETLALYYEEFAAWLEAAGRWNQAEEVYKMGLEKSAQPIARLTRKFGDFEKRYQARPEDATEPSSPALPTVRPALAAKLDPFAAASTAAADADPQAASRANASTKSKKAKLAIFSDNGEDERPASGGSSGGWDNIGTIAERKKENTISARPMAGETLKSGVQQMGVPKMAIFKDESKSRSHSQAIATDHPARDQRTVNARTGKLERVFVNLEAMYPNRNDPSEEYCFEQLRAAKRGWLNIDWHARRAAEAQSSRSVDKPKKAKAFEIKRDDTLAIEPERIQIVTQQQTLALNDENAENIDPQQAQTQAAFAKKLARKEERANRTKKIKLREETKTVQTNLNSPSGPKIRKKKARDPTMTMQSKLATDEVYDLFNQPIESASLEDSESDSSSSDGEDDDYTSGGESVTGAISGAASDFGEDTQRDVAGEATSTGWTTFDPKAILAGREHELDDTTTHTDMTSRTETTTHTHETTQDMTTSSAGSAASDEEDASDAEDAEDFSEEVVTTPVSPTPGEQSLPTRYVPIPPEGWEAPVGPYRDPSQVAQNRLPFMTPIVEKTESSFGAATGHREPDYFSAKTPCPKASGNRRTPTIPEGLDHDELMSSPFESMVKTESRQASPPPKMTLPEPVSEPSLAIRAKSSIQQASTIGLTMAQKGPIILDSQVNPMDETVRATILREMQPPLSSYEGYHYHPSESSSRRPEIKRFCKAVSAKSTPGKAPVLTLPGSDRQYTIKRDLGAGAYATLYLVESVDVSSAESKEGDDNGLDRVEMGRGAFASRLRRPVEALKMEDPPSAWEFYMLSLAHRRLGVSRAAASIVRAHEMHLYADECFLLEDYRSSGTLLDLVNGAASMGVAQETASEKGCKGVDEVLAMFLAAELLRTIEALHAKGIVHGDLKPDNVLLRLDTCDTTPTSTTSTEADTLLASPYRADGSAGWASKGIALIDFGRAINMAHFAPGVQFLADWATTATDCAEMREARPWTHQVDYFGLANCLHTLLFGRYIETLADKTHALGGGGGVKMYRLREGLKRYWQTDIWADVFGVLLNPGRVEGGELTMQERVARRLRECRENMERWLEAHAERGVGLRGLLRRVESGVAKRR